MWSFIIPSKQNKNIIISSSGSIIIVNLAYVYAWISSLEILIINFSTTEKNEKNNKRSKQNNRA